MIVYVHCRTRNPYDKGLWVSINTVCETGARTYEESCLLLEHAEAWALDLPMWCPRAFNLRREPS